PGFRFAQSGLRLPRALQAPTSRTDAFYADGLRRNARSGREALCDRACSARLLHHLAWRCGWRPRRDPRGDWGRLPVGGAAGAGTRGKSPTTRLIAAGLRAGGLRVVAKTTGTEPRLIRPDGSEAPWRRRGPPSVREQAQFFAKAVQLRADAAVVECMAVRPEM